MPGGDLHWLWSPYALYETVDLVYSRQWYDLRRGFTSAQAMMNIAESVLNVLYLWLAGRESPVAVLVGFTAVVMTASKTVLYWLRDWVRSSRARTANSVASEATDECAAAPFLGVQQAGWDATYACIFFSLPL